jgi:hypothetical protein
MIVEIEEVKVILKKCASFPHWLAAFECIGSSSSRDEGRDSLIQVWNTSQPRRLSLTRPSSCLSARRSLHPTPTRSLLCTMAASNITTTFAGHSNQGLQIGHNSGTIHLAPGKCPHPP